MAAIVQTFTAHPKMVWEIVPEIHIWSGARSCYGSNSPEHSQHIQKWSGKLFLKYIFSPE